MIEFTREEADMLHEAAYQYTLELQNCAVSDISEVKEKILLLESGMEKLHKIIFPEGDVDGS